MCPLSFYVINVAVEIFEFFPRRPESRHLGGLVQSTRHADGRQLHHSFIHLTAIIIIIIDLFTRVTIALNNIFQLTI